MRYNQRRPDTLPIKDEALRVSSLTSPSGEPDRLAAGILSRTIATQHWPLDVMSGRIRGLTSNGATSLAYQQQDGDFRYFIAVINEDRRAKGLPLIEFE